MNHPEDLTRKPLLRDEITETLRAFIDRQRTDQLVRIEAEREMANRLKVSRLSLRSAIQPLVEEGLLFRKRGSGTYIVPRPSPAMVDLFVAPDVGPSDPFSSEFFAALSRYLAEQSIQLRLLHAAHLPSRQTSNPLIVVGLVDGQLMRQLRATHASVTTTQSSPEAIDGSQICFDDYRIGSDAATVLHEAGHRRIVHLAGSEVFSYARQRKRGFTDRLKALGVSVDVAEGQMSWRGGYEVGAKIAGLLRRRDPPTAVFAANDWMALGLLQRLQEGRVAVPGTVSVLGCGDIYLAEEVNPRLSTFSCDMGLLVRELFSHMRAGDANGNGRPMRILLPAHYVERESLRRFDRHP